MATDGARTEQAKLADGAGLTQAQAIKMSGADLAQAKILKEAGNKTVADRLGTTQALLADDFNA